jgi:3-oxoacyl-[acyl-carrier protein] reductase
LNLNFENKTAVVTGGSKGIGKAISEKLLLLKSTVILTGTGNRPDWCDKYERCFYNKVDFTNENEILNFITKLTQLNKIDILINNAGILVMHDISEIKMSEWESVIAINLTAPMRLIKAVAPLMKNHKHGRILNISSTAGFISKPKQSSYSSTKSGIIGLTRSSALDLASYGILVNALCPGTTKTKMIDELNLEQKSSILENIPIGRFATVDEISDYAIFLCSEYNSYMTGQTLLVDGGFTAK